MQLCKSFHLRPVDPSFPLGVEDDEGVGEQDVAQHSKEQGLPLRDDFVVHEGPQMASPRR